MPAYCFTVDDNVRFLKEITETTPKSIFDHPYAAMLRRLHERFGIKIQLNLFYEMPGFTLADMTAAYRHEWQENADWLKLSFHSKEETDRPYISSPYEEVYRDCEAVHREICRFAGTATLAATTTVHCCYTTREGAKALADLGMRGLLGLFGTRASYSLPDEITAILRQGKTFSHEGITYAKLDLVVNCFKHEDLLKELAPLLTQDEVHVMIHEQYFYPDYRAYQPDFEEKLATVFTRLAAEGFENRFLEEMI